MGILQYREIQWDDFNKPRQKKGIGLGEILAWGIAGISLIVGVFFLLPFEDLRSTPEALVSKYSRTYPWLNRCNLSCEKSINASFLHAQHSCGALYSLYNEDENSNLLAWRTALDDRLTALRCPGFPRLPEHILLTVSTTEGVQAEQQEQWKAEKQALAEYAASHQLERYRQSLSDGSLLQFVESIEELDEDTLLLSLNSAWFRIKQDRREQMNEVLWQKWATIHSLHAPMRARIELRNAEGEIVGGSFRNGDYELWLR